MKQVCIWDKSVKKIADGAKLIAVSKKIKTQSQDTKASLFALYGDLMNKRHLETRAKAMD